MVRDDADVAYLAEYGIDCDPRYFDPRGKIGMTDNAVFGADCVVVTFVQNIPDIAWQREHKLDVPRRVLVPV